MSTPSYWTPLCDLVAQIRCHARVVEWIDGKAYDGYWSQMLIEPVEGYLEAGAGPTHIRNVAWVELAASKVQGGLAGRPLRFIDIKGEIAARLQGLPMVWELRSSTWSLERLFVDEPVEIFRFLNPSRKAATC
jgi:hypothetical protein